MIAISLIVVPLALLAISLLWQGFRAKRASGLDGPAFVLDRATRMLPHDRRDWGRAMTAELARVTEGRWRFALGCAAVALARPVKPRLSEASAVVVLGVAACAAIGAYVLTGYPLAGQSVHNPLVDDRRIDLLIACGIVLGAYLWVAIKPPGALADSRAARRIGAGAGLLYGAGLLAVTLTSESDGLMFLFLAPMLILPLTARIAAGVARSVRAGVAAAVWAGLVTGLSAFGVRVVTALYQAGIDGVPPYDLELWFFTVVGQQLAAAIHGLVMFPIWALLLGLIGAKTGKAVTA